MIYAFVLQKLIRAVPFPPYLQTGSCLDVINTSIYYSAHRQLRHSETLTLCEAIIYYATVDQQATILKVSACVNADA